MKKIDRDNLLRKISTNLRKLREEHGFTQEQVADKIGIHLVTYQKYESREPYNIRITNLYQLARLYDVSVDSILE